MTDDPFGLRRFGFYSEADIALTSNLGPPTDEMCMVTTHEYTAMAPERPPDLAAFLTYWTPERIARAKREETAS